MNDDDVDTKGTKGNNKDDDSTGDKPVDDEPTGDDPVGNKPARDYHDKPNIYIPGMDIVFDNSDNHDEMDS